MAKAKKPEAKSVDYEKVHDELTQAHQFASLATDEAKQKTKEILNKHFGKFAKDSSDNS